MSDYDKLTRGQLGLATTAQLARFGWSRNAVLHAVEVGRLFPVRRSVYRAAGVAMTQEMAWLGAVLAAGDAAFLSHVSAACHFGLKHFSRPTQIDVLVDGPSQPRLAGVRGHRTLWLPPSHRTTYRSIPTTSVERTFIDACGLLTERRLALSVDDAMRRKLLRLPLLVRAVDQVPSSGRRKIVPRNRARHSALNCAKADRRDGRRRDGRAVAARGGVRL
jgi:hypothetical protein